MIGIIVFGFIITASSSPAIAKRIEVDKFFFLKKQILFIFCAASIIIAISFLDIRQIKLMAVVGICIIIALLFLVLAIGSGIKGSKRWISIFGFALQPSEFAKIFFVIFHAYILNKFKNHELLTKYSISLTLLIVIASLTVLEPDFGMTLTIAILWATQLFLYGISLIFISFIGIVVAVGAVVAYVSLPHVEDRINKFLDSDNKSYQVERSLDAFVNGSFFGVGPGNGTVKQYIPDAHTDFVFAVIGEEYGIFGCIFLILLFSYLITRIVRYILDEEDLFSYIALSGLMVEFVFQTIVNMGVSLKLFPTKGMTLPFISYGGSSMIATAICFGLILAFTKKKYSRAKG